MLKDDLVLKEIEKQLKIGGWPSRLCEGLKITEHPSQVGGSVTRFVCNKLGQKLMPVGSAEWQRYEALVVIVEISTELPEGNSTGGNDPI